MRRRRWPVVGLAVVGAFLALEAVPGFPGHAQAALVGDLAVSDAGRVVAKIPLLGDDGSGRSCAALETQFGVGNDLLKNSEIGWYASIWPSYHALTAFYVRSLHPGEAGCVKDLERTVTAINASYWDESIARAAGAFDQGPNRLHFQFDLPRVDDSLWMSLAVMDDYAETGDPAPLERAEAVFRLAVSNWDPHRGGIYWEDHLRGATNYDKTVVSNAPAVVLGAELFSQTGQRQYLAWSEKIMGWLDTTLLNPRTGLYDDGIDDHVEPARIHPVVLTYNQGIVLGAMAALSRIDPASYPLSEAMQFAARCETYFGTHHSYGLPGYDSIWAYNLLWTAGLAGSPAFSDAALASVRRAITSAPSGASGLYDQSSELTLDELSVLPAGAFGRLYPAMAHR